MTLESAPSGKGERRPSGDGGPLPAEDRTAARLRREGLWRKLHNYLAAEGEMARGAPVMRAKPYWMTVDPTSFCQLKCPFCPTGAGRGVRPKASLPFERFEALMEVLGPVLIHIDFMNWGEPLLNKDIYRMAALAKRHRVDTMLSTNLNAFPEGAAREMVASGLDRVVLSIDGLTQETYSKYRVGGDFRRVMENLKALAAEKRRTGSRTPVIAWQFLAFKHNEHEADRVRGFALAAGADEAGVTPANLPFRPGIKEEWLPTRPELRRYDPESFPESPPWHWEASAAKEGEAPVEVEVEVYSKAERELCNWPWAGITVNPDLSVSPCCSVEEREYDFGVLDARAFGRGGTPAERGLSLLAKRAAFMELWNNASFRKAREHVAAFVRGERRSIPRSSHACERCFSIGRARFQLPRHLLEGGPDA